MDCHPLDRARDCGDLVGVRHLRYTGSSGALHDPREMLGELATV